jgi:hypothetical protein
MKDKQMTLRSLKQLLMTMAIAVWTVVFALAVGTLRFAARAPVTVKVKSVPAIVAVTVDGVEVADGNFIATPYELTLSPGKHDIRVYRPGYVSQKLRVEGLAGDRFNLTDIVLERDSSILLGQIELAPTDETLHYIVETGDGLAKETIPGRLAELPLGEALDLVLRDPDTKSPLVRCRLTLEGDASVNFRKEGNAWRTGGCKKVKDTK